MFEGELIEECVCRARAAIAQVSLSLSLFATATQLINTLLDNILNNPTETRYRSFKALQPKIAREVLALEQGRALLVEIGFRTRTKDFTQEWFIPEEWRRGSFGMQKIEWSQELINNKMLEYEENAERVRVNKEKEKNVEASRKVSRAIAIHGRHFDQCSCVDPFRLAHWRKQERIEREWPFEQKESE